MTATTHAHWSASTEALEVARAFPDAIRGKTILITGVNLKGIGFTTAQAFASQAPAHLIITGRNVDRLQNSVNALKSEYPEVDYRILKVNLSSQKAVREAAEQFLSWKDIPQLDIVVNSAGIINSSERTMTEEGVELTWATNHLGHFLLTCLIMPKILKAAEKNAKGSTRIINVSSGSPTVATPRFSDLNFNIINKDLPKEEQPPYELLKAFGNKDPESKAYVSTEAYNQSKVANVLFSIGLNSRLFERYGILSLSLHPGVIQTELSREAPPEMLESIETMANAGRFTWRTLGAGASTSLTAATDPKLSLPIARTDNGKENVGVFLSDCQIFDGITPGAASSANADRLWKISEEFVKETFVW